MKIVCLIGGRGACAPTLAGGVECAAVVLLSPVSDVTAPVPVTDLSGRAQRVQKRELAALIRAILPDALLCCGDDALSAGLRMQKKCRIPAFFLFPGAEEWDGLSIPRRISGILCRSYNDCRAAIQAGANPDNVLLYIPDQLSDACAALLRRCGKRGSVVLCGAYGMGNLGDDAILDAILGDLRTIAPDDRITVLCRNPRLMRCNHCVNTIYTFRLLRIARALRGARLFISGGGTLITDNTSTRSLFYYLATIFLAHFAGAKVMLYGCGIGPFARQSNRKAAGRILNRCADLITTRDDVSAEQLAAMSVSKPQILRAADPAFEIACAKLDLSAEQHLVDAVRSQGRYAVFAPRSWNNDAEILPQIAQAADRLYARSGLIPVLLPMAYPGDCATLRRLKSMIAAPAVVVDQSVTYRTALALISNAELVIGMRLHALIFAAVAGIPSVGISYDIKVKSFMEYINSGLCAEYDCLTAETLCAMASDALAHPAAPIAHLHARCTVNADAARTLLQ